jgi:trk system potassium uptake protein TrkA
MVGHSLRQLDFRNKYQANIIAVKRGDEFSLALRADERIEEGDVLVVVGKNDDLRRLER